MLPGGLTNSGHPLAAASIVATMRDGHIADNARRSGADVIGPRLEQLARMHEVVGEVRGTGVFRAI